MNFLLFSTIFVWWLIAGLILFVCFRLKHLSKDNRDYESLPVIYDECSGITAKHVYLIRLSYGHRNKRFFFPSATFYIRFYDEQNKKLANLQLKPKLLTENHRRYLQSSSNQPNNKVLHGKLLSYFFCVL